jgi:hypothetical protein
MYPMQIPARLLVIALFAIALYLPAAIGQKPAIGQQSGTVNVRPRVATPLVIVDRTRVPLGELVTFTLTPAGVAMSSRSKVTIYFGDEEHRVIQNKIDWLYRKPGNYTYSILVEPSGSPTPPPTPAPPGVKLSAAPRSVEIDRPVDFAAQLSRPYPNIRYRFVFGDKNQTDWQDKPGTTHAYKVAGRYLAYVDIGVMSNGGVKPLGGSARQPIEVMSPAPRPVSVTLSASPVPVAEKQPATFVARVDSSEPNIRYRFDFGDRSGSTAWQVSPRTTHTYSAAGNYPASVEIRVTNSRSGQQTASSKPLSIEVTATKRDAKPTVDLTAVPQSVPAGFPVFFRAISASANSNTRYRFSFGDGSSGGWKEKPEDAHIYSRAGNYPAFVEIGSASNGSIDALAASGRKRVRVVPIISPVDPPINRTPPDGRPTPQPSTSPRPSPPIASPTRTSPTPGPSQSPIGTASPAGSPSTSPNASPSVAETPSPSPVATSSLGTGAVTPSPSPTISPSETPTPYPAPDSGSSNNWWKYLLAALILFAGYQGWKYFYAPRPTLVPNLDPGNSDLGSESGPLGINFQMELNRNVSDGQVAVNTDGGSLIKSERKSDD